MWNEKMIEQLKVPILKAALLFTSLYVDSGIRKFLFLAIQDDELMKSLADVFFGMVVKDE
jgi:hypothetical protein